MATVVALNGFANIEPSRCAEHDAQLPERSLDMAIMLDVYHELSCPHEMLASIRSNESGGPERIM